ncbi:DNA-formamidopyrimidine glycosylase family protein [Pedobacter cryoconitis]|uniref:DNA-formamidopyrimidine glycosylase family protein n=1 Tax=Pedobacter cryoconitis TaxID=188932 RepID=UPI00161FE655|nr:DNA-formamidopyrimidine glycosylase family protein [Pedobacter cryoconitis]MBB5647197.1 formamidopyrimidine-DNA glycosylase [Pedobacter cryoconitis]
MFELPYLESCAEIFEKRFKNRVLQKIDLRYEKCLNVSKAELIENLMEHELKKVWREGLSLMFQFKNHAELEMSLSPAAEFRIIEQNQEAGSGLLSLYFSGGAILSVKDTRKLSTFRLNPIHTAVPDVLSKAMTINYLIDLFSNSEEQVKHILMDQNLIRGMGEAYADEILWYAGISPFSIASKIPTDKVKGLFKTTKYVLLDAIKQTRKINTLEFNQTHADLLMIHHTGKKKSPTGGVIKMNVISGTKAYYTDEQRLYV